MAFVDIGGMPYMMIGGTHRQGVNITANFSGHTMDAVNESVAMIGQIYNQDLGTHTIDTTGSSKLQWKTSGVTFANTATRVKVGLAPVNFTVGPPARAVNASDVITFDVHAELAGNTGAITATAWQLHTPTSGTKTIAHGDIVAFCVQMTVRGGADAISTQTIAGITTNSLGFPCCTAFTGTYGATATFPNMVITYNDGALGYIFGSNVMQLFNALTWNSSSATKEYGNAIMVPVPMRCYGITVNVSVGGNTDFVLYRDLVSPSQLAIVSVDANAISIANTNTMYTMLFPTPIDLVPGVTYIAAVKPTTTTNITVNSKSFFDVAHQFTEGLGANCYEVSRTSLVGDFAAVNAFKDVAPIGLLVSALPHPARPIYTLGV